MLSDMKKLCDGELDESMICNIIEKNLEVSPHGLFVVSCSKHETISWYLVHMFYQYELLQKRFIIVRWDNERG